MCLQEGSGSIFSAPFPELWSLNRKNYIGKGESTETKTNFSLQHLLENSENGTWKSSTAPSTLHFPPFSSFQWHFWNAHSKSCPHRGLSPFPSYYSQLQQGNTGAAQLSCARIGIFGHLCHKAAAFPACSCPCAGSTPSISLPTASMACHIRALPLPSDAVLLFYLSTHSPVWFQGHQHQPGLKADKLSPYFSSLPPP